MELIDRLRAQAIKQKGIQADEALDLFVTGADAPFRVLAAAAEIREACKGKAVSLCAICHAKSDPCSEDCAFCAQSVRHRTEIPINPLKAAGQIVAEAKAAARSGAEWFGIVTSGKRLSGKREWAQLLKAIAGIREAGLSPCASLGRIDAGQAAALKAAGLVRYHHNLGTARSYFPKICTTHAYEEDLDTVRVAKAAGLSVCSGGIIGLGEGVTQRIELAETLRSLAVDSIPLSFFTPSKGTPLERALPLRPLEILMTIAVFRFMLPDKDIRLCGGKEKNLRQLLPLALVAGANALMIGNCLTTEGRDPALDRELVCDLGLSLTREAGTLCTCEAKGGTGCRATRPGKGRKGP